MPPAGNSVHINIDENVKACMKYFMTWQDRLVSTLIRANQLQNIKDLTAEKIEYTETSEIRRRLGRTHLSDDDVHISLAFSECSTRLIFPLVFQWFSRLLSASVYFLLTHSKTKMNSVRFNHCQRFAFICFHFVRAFLFDVLGDLRGQSMLDKFETRFALVWVRFSLLIQVGFRHFALMHFGCIGQLLDVRR